MALIICPECGGKISDKADICIHCGYPINERKSKNEDEIIDNKFCCIRGVKYDLSDVLNLNDRPEIESKIRNLVPEINFLDATRLSWMIRDMKKIPEEYNWSEFKKYQNWKCVEAEKKELREKGINPDAPASCPRCGSTQFSTTQRGHSILFGWLGSGDPQNVCQKCGYKWTPGRTW